MANNITTAARCHCGQNRFPFEVTKANLPLTVYICHCTTCRLVSGSMCSVYAALPNAPFHEIPETLKAYNVSPTSARYFCKTCSTQMFLHTSENWLCTTGCLETRVTSGDGDLRIGDVVKVQYQQHVCDTGDGGMAVWIDGTKTFWEGPTSREMNREEVIDMYKTAKNDSREKSVTGELLGYCHCRRFKLAVKLHGNRLQNTHCTCDSCRTTAGSEFMQYFMPNINNVFIETSDGGRHPFPRQEDEWKELLPDINIYRSSEAVMRGSCGTCDAKVFFYSSKMDDIAEPAWGLFTADTGGGIIRDDVLDWTTKEEAVDCADDAVGREGILVDHFTKGFTAWRTGK